MYLRGGVGVGAGDGGRRSRRRQRSGWVWPVQCFQERHRLVAGWDVLRATLKQNDNFYLWIILSPVALSHIVSQQQATMNYKSNLHHWQRLAQRAHYLLSAARHVFAVVRGKERGIWDSCWPGSATSLRTSCTSTGAGTAGSTCPARRTCRSRTLNHHLLSPRLNSAVGMWKINKKWETTAHNQFETIASDVILSAADISIKLLLLTLVSRFLFSMPYISCRR